MIFFSRKAKNRPVLSVGVDKSSVARKLSVLEPKVIKAKVVFGHNFLLEVVLAGLSNAWFPNYRPRKIKRCFPSCPFFGPVIISAPCTIDPHMHKKWNDDFLAQHQSLVAFFYLTGGFRETPVSNSHIKRLFRQNVRSSVSNIDRVLKIWPPHQFLISLAVPEVTFC